jgi:Nitroreductase family
LKIMTNRRQFLKTFTLLAATAHATPVLAVDKDYQAAAEKIWRPKNAASPNITDRSKEWVRMATLAASSHNSQPWQFKLSNNSITIIPDFKRRCPAVDPDDSHLFKSLGCAAENLIHAIAADGFHADAQFDPKQDAVVINFESSTSKHENLAAAIVNRRCSRTPYDGKPIAAPVLTTLTTAASSNDINPLILNSPQQMEAMLEYVRQGNIAQFDDPAFVKELRDWVRFNPADAIATGDGLAGEVSGQPAIPGWLGRRIFSLISSGNKQADIDAKAIRSSAGIMAFVGARDDKASWVAAGRAYQRFALQATALNIRNAFINQPIEVRSLRPQLHAWLGLPQQYVHLIVRYGTGPITPHSLRRPIEQVIIT